MGISLCLALKQLKIAVSYNLILAFILTRSIKGIDIGQC